MIRDDFVFVVIGVILGGLVVIIGIVLSYYWLKEQKNNHLGKRYKIEANVYTTHNQQTVNTQPESANGTEINDTPVEPIYAAVDSFRRQRSDETENNALVEVHASATENVSDHERSSRRETDVNEQNQQLPPITRSRESLPSLSHTTASPPPLPIRNYSSDEVQHCSSSF